MEGVRAPVAPRRASSCGLPLLLLQLLLLTCCRAEEGKSVPYLLPYSSIPLRMHV